MGEDKNVGGDRSVKLEIVTWIIAHPAYTACEMHITRHDCDTFSVNGA